MKLQKSQFRTSRQGKKNPRSEPKNNLLSCPQSASGVLMKDPRSTNTHGGHRAMFNGRKMIEFLSIFFFLLRS